MDGRAGEQEREPERRRAYEEFLRAQTLDGLRIVCLMGAALVPATMLLDIVTQPDHVWPFLVIRLIVCVGCLSLYFASRTSLARHPNALSVVASLWVAAGIEAMVVVLGPHATPYYAGLNLVILGVGILIPWTGRQMMWVCVAILAMYLLPVFLLEGGAIDATVLFNNFYFLLATSLITGTSSHFSAKLRERAFFARTALETRTQELDETTVKLQDSVAKLQELDRLKSQFFANVSHELRTPLTLILSPLEAVLQDDENELPLEMRDYLSSMHRNATRLLRLINNLLDLSKLEAGKVYLRYEPVELSAFLGALLPPFYALARNKKVALRLEGTPVEPVQADEEKIDTVFQNLIANALKFTGEGGEVVVRVHEDDTHVIAAVTDTGIGIAERDLPIIFNRFAQADGSATRRFGGTGIGLALVKELVEVHGGTVAARSKPGEGSTFEVRLPKGTAHINEELRERRAVDLPVVRDRRESNRDPVAALMPRGAPDGVIDWAEPDEADDEPASEAGRPRILVVEDNGDLRRFLARLLRREFRVAEAVDGDEGLALARELKPDLVVSDVMMPGRSGYDLTRELKQDPATRGIPVLLLTAKRAVDAALEGFSHGADDYLGKPFNSRELIARIRAQLRLRDLSRELAQAQKLSMLGTLAAGLAHEVRNPVNFILNSLPVMRKLLPEDTRPEVRELLDIVEEGGKRINGVVRDLLDFSRVDAAAVAPWNAAEGVRTTLQLLGPQCQRLEVRLELDPAAELEGHGGQLNQVLMNLLDNATRAAKAVLVVRAQRERDGVRVSVRDDGAGIAPEHLHRIFDPFFTTRPVGEGTGLGLHLARQTITAHGGTLEAFSRPGEGAEFTFWLPLHPRPRAASEERLHAAEARP